MTLAEVLLALTVLTIGLVGLVSLLPLAASGVHEGGYRSRAAFLATDRLEQIRRTVGSGAAVIAAKNEGRLPPPHEAFDRVVQVRDCGLPPGCSGVETPGARQVTVTVTYPAVPGHGPASAHRGAVVLSTYIGPR